MGFIVVIITLFFVGALAGYCGCQCSEGADKERRIREDIKAKKRFADMKRTEHHEINQSYIGTHYNSLDNFF